MTTRIAFIASRDKTSSRPSLTRKCRPAARWGWSAALALVLGACASPMDTDEARLRVSQRLTQKLQSSREAQLQSNWRGKPYEALLEAFGSPPLMMNTLGYRPNKTSLVVYGVVDQSSNCVDTFSMVKNDQTGQWTVADYFCR